MVIYVHRNRKDGEPRTATSTFTQLLAQTTCSILLYVHRDYGGTIRDGDLPLTEIYTYKK